MKTWQILACLIIVALAAYLLIYNMGLNTGLLRMK
jgi:cytochrome c-type biogenesis protein CcmE